MSVSTWFQHPSCAMDFVSVESAQNAREFWASMLRWVGMGWSHYEALLAAYALALLAWAGVWRLVPQLWPHVPTLRFDHPWIEVGLALAAVAGTLAIGQLYTRHWLLHVEGRFAPIVESVDQVLIFSPFLLLLLVRGQPLRSAWIKSDRVAARISIGLGLALLAIRMFTLVRAGSDDFVKVVTRVYSYQNLGYAVQVFLEDAAIAVLVIRLGACLRPRWAIILTAAIFSAGHIPTFIATGTPMREMPNLIFDFGLAAAAISAVQRSADIWWFWGIHFAMDMMQFYALKPAS